MSSESTRAGLTTMQPIERRNLGSDVYRILRDRILSQELTAGEKLSDLRLSSELGVSRTPIREALHQLAQDGVVVAEPNRGFFVATFTRRDLEEIFELRRVLELYAIRGLRNADHREELERAMFELEHVERLIGNATTAQQRMDAGDAFLKTDRGFHSWLVSTVGNRRMSTIVGGLWTQIAIFQQVDDEIPEWMLVAVKQHRELLTMLLDGNLDGAVELMTVHLDDMQTLVLEDFSS
ncbi:MAG: GntR family transcriptional regulator [Thermomicrobiales bacterium]|nr:GntR family transcriptional regulator [Thermomicrobiales bacterium]MCO5218139.1 GntR family transcriptional regulator [Thermomicrobiales bacterium]MCO5224861.1 GntR family transcriptional regulator [Thermomicrobiales bacterium]MCO5228961.1 GntR family transcriptional regulator [Thermomicrobiales bacterium]